MSRRRSLWTPVGVSREGSPADTLHMHSLDVVGSVPFPLCSHSCLGWSSALKAHLMYSAFHPGTTPYTSFQKVPWDRFCLESYFLETGSFVSKTECKQCCELEGRDTCEQPRINCHTRVSRLGCSLRNLLVHYPAAASHRASLRLDMWEET